MDRREFMKKGALSLSALAAGSLLSGPACSRSNSRPNIILFVADDLGYGELGCYGQDKIKTPHIDRLAAEGMKFTRFYSGSPVCAPSRCVLMTGKHSGHAFIRDNHEVKPEGQLPIPDESVTVAELLKANGYTTGIIGKWGLGFPGSEGDPNRQGFDFFYGYNCQRHAHNHYPRYLWKNDQKIDLEGNDRGLTGRQYAPDLMEKEALDFIRGNVQKEQPFFLFFATTIPHLALQVPEDSLNEYIGQWDDPPYDGKNGYLPHDHPRAAYAAMVSRMDRTMGRMLDLLKQLHVDDNTLVIFSSDNGASYVGGYDREFFRGNGPLRSHKGYVYEGGIRIPFIARWPGRIRAGQVTEEAGAFQDILPTLLDSAGLAQNIPPGVDGISLSPLLFNASAKQKHDYLYMEFPAYGGQQMVRLGRWKAVRQNLMKQPDAPIELYDLKNDLAEQHDVAANHADLVARCWEIMKKEHVASAEFPFEALDRQVPPVNISGDRKG